VAEHGTPDQITSQAPFIQALVQKSVTAITNLAGQLSFGMLGESRASAQGGTAKKMVLRLLLKNSKRPRICTDFHGF
jgi:hypothetical protein